MSSGKTIGGWVSGELLERAEKAIAAFDGSASEYVVALIDRDTKGQLPGAKEKDAIIRLARVFNPAIEGDLSDALKGARNQSRIIARLLDALLEALKRGDGFEVNSTFHLYDTLDRLSLSLSRTPTARALLQTLADCVEQEQLRLAAEDKGTYGGPKPSDAMQSAIESASQPSAKPDEATPAKRK